MTGEPLPSRILIPLANPRTAAELVRIGASLLEPRRRAHRAGHRRGPRGDAAVRGRDPRPPGATAAPARARVRARGDGIRPLVRIGRRAAEGIVEAAAEEEADLIIFGWGGSPGPTATAAGRSSRPTIDEVVRESPCDIAVVKQRGAATSGGSSSRSAAARTPSWRCASRRAALSFGATSR